MSVGYNNLPSEIFPSTFFVFLFLSFFEKKEKKKEEKESKYAYFVPLFISRWISQIRRGQLFSTRPSFEEETSRCRSFHPAEWNPVSTLSFLPPPRHSCHRITSRFLCAIAAVITPPFSSLSRAFVRSSPYHSRGADLSFLLPLTRDEEEILSGSRPGRLV